MFRKVKVSRPIRTDAIASVGVFVALIIAGLELLARDKRIAGLSSWFLAILACVAAVVAWDKATPPADHLPLGGVAAGLALFFVIAYGTALAWSFVREVLDRDRGDDKGD